MQNSIWKLTALAGVVGIGFLVVLQAQRGLSQPAEEHAGEAAAEAVPGQDAGRSIPGPNDLGEPEPIPDSAVALGQYEPSQPDEDVPAQPAADFQPAARLENGDAGQQRKADDQSDRTGELPRFVDSKPRDSEDAPPLPAAMPPAASPPVASPGVDRPSPFEPRPGTVAAIPHAADEAEVIKQVGHEQSDTPSRSSPFETDGKPASGRDAAEEHKRSDPAEAGPMLTGPMLNPVGTSDDAPPQPETDDAPAFEREPTRTGDPPPFAQDDEPALAADQPAQENTTEHENDPPPVPFDEELRGSPAMPADGSPRERFQPLFPTDEMREPNPSRTSTPRQPDPGAFDETNESSDAAADSPPNDPDRPAIAEPDPAAEPQSEPVPDRPSSEAASQPSSETTPPQRLDPPPDASRLQPQRPKALQGDGTVDGAAPGGRQRPQLSIEKLAPQHAVLGKPLIYTILVKNVGESAARQVVVEDRIPKGVTLTGTIPQAQLADKRLIWDLGEVKAGEQRKIMVRVVPSEEGNIGSIATVNFVAEVAARTRVTAPRLGFELIGPRQARVGEPVTFEFKLTNNGTADANGVWIRDVIPDGLKHPAGKDLEYEIGQIPAGQSKQIKLTLTAARVGETVNRGIVTAEGGIRVEQTAPLEIVGSKLLVTRTGPKRGYVGRKAVFTNLVTNDSGSPATGVIVTESVPAGMEFVEATAGGRYDAAKRTVTWTIGRLGPGENQTLQVTLLPRATGAQAAAVQAADEHGGAARVASQTSVEGFAALGLEIPAVGTPVAVGESIPLRIVARNRGTGAATNVRIEVAVPAEAEIISVRGPGKSTQADGRIIFDSIPSVEAGAKMEFDVVLKATAGGDARVGLTIAADQMQKPLTREEAILILPRN